MGETILMMAAGYHKKSCMKRVASPGSMHDTGCLGLVHWDDPEGWYDPPSIILQAHCLTNIIN